MKDAEEKKPTVRWYCSYWQHLRHLNVLISIDVGDYERSYLRRLSSPESKDQRLEEKLRSSAINEPHQLIYPYHIDLNLSH